MKSFLLLLAAAGLASAHFEILYPEWRADTLSHDEHEHMEGMPVYDQWVYPCANVPTPMGNATRTSWPLTGGSVKLDLHHPWSYVFVNLGLSGNVTNFNITLTPEFYNVTGSGEFCIKELPIPEGSGISDGDLGSIQVVTVGDRGSALYNCADIRFSESAELLSDDECTSNENITFVTISEETDAAAGLVVNHATMSIVVGLAVAFAYGIGL